MANLSDLNQQFIIEVDTNVPTGCTNTYTDSIISCDESTSIILSGGTINLSGSVLTSQITSNIISGNTIYSEAIYSGGTNILDLFNLKSTYVTGGTYNNGTTTFTNTTGGTFSVSGYTLPQIDTVITGVTVNNSNNTYTLNNNTGGTITYNGLTDVFITGGTYSSGTTTFTNTTGGTFDINGFFKTVVAGDNVNIDFTDINKPIINATFSQTGKYLISGGASWAGTGYTYNLSLITYFFNGNKIANPIQITLNTADSYFDRLDAIVVNELGNISIISGETSGNAITPSIPDDQLLIQYVLVSAGSSQPSITSENIYIDGDEWLPSTYTTSGVAVGTTDFSATTSPYQGSHYVSNNRDGRTGNRFVRTTLIDLGNFSVLSLWVKFNSVIPTTKKLNARFENSAGGLIGSTVNLFSYGISRNVVNTWQLAIVPTTVFGAISNIKGLKIILAGTTNGVLYNWDLDYMILTNGSVPQSNIPTISFYKDGAAISTENAVDIRQGLGVGVAGVLNPTLNRVEYTFSANTITGGTYSAGTTTLNDISGGEIVITGYTTGSTITGLPISSLLGATTANTINNSGFAQEWKWDSLNNNIGLKISSTAATQTVSTIPLFEVTQSGQLLNNYILTSAAKISNSRYSYQGATVALELDANAVGNASVNTALYINRGGICMGEGTKSRYEYDGSIFIKRNFAAGTFIRLEDDYGSFSGLRLQSTQGANLGGGSVFASVITNYGRQVRGINIGLNTVNDYFAVWTYTAPNTPFSPPMAIIVNPQGQVGVNKSIGTQLPSAQFEIESLTKGFLKPRMTTAQITAIASPATGLEIYNTDTNTPNYYNGTSWQSAPFSNTPSSATATGTKGTICWDTSYIYICTATNTWVRSPLTTW